MHFGIIACYVRLPNSERSTFQSINFVYTYILYYFQKNFTMMFKKIMRY
jgi:hypothetical protein